MKRNEKGKIARHADSCERVHEIVWESEALTCDKISERHFLARPLSDPHHAKAAGERRAAMTASQSLRNWSGKCTSAANCNNKQLVDAWSLFTRNMTKWRHTLSWHLFWHKIVICVPYLSRHMFLTHIRTISDICGWCIRHWNRTRRRRRWRKVRDPYLTGGESVTSFCRSDSRHIVWTSIVYNIYCINTRTHTHINVKNPNLEEIWLRILLLHRLQNASNDFRQLNYSWLQSISVLRDSLGSRQ